MLGSLIKTLSDYLAGPVQYGVIILVFRAGVYLLVEGRQPAQPVSYRKVWRRDLLAWAVFSFMIVPAADAVASLLSIPMTLPAAMRGWPFMLRVLLYILLTDLGAYWIHRLNHTKHFWRVHKWHHSPTHMYWLAGVRCSFMQLILVSLPAIIAAVLVDLTPSWVGLLLVLRGTLENDWMHLNVRWGNRWLEWVIVTPRYHHIHHSDNPAHYGSNIAVTFAFWDRLFGTYLDPELVPRPLSFGIGEEVPAIRLALGV